jgi:hypothetical protein
LTAAKHVIQPHEQEAKPGKDDDKPYQIEKDPLEKRIAVRLIADDENIWEAKREPANAAASIR